MNRLSLLPHFLASSAVASVVASVVAGSIFLFRPGAAEDQQSRGQWRLHESFPVLIGGTLTGGAIGGVIAAWFLLKIDLSAIEDLNKKLDKLNIEFDVTLKTELQDKITQKIDKLQDSIDKLNKPTS